ncbi:MAG: 16S rRNA (cytosine(1402)-N(4))-methyltransferase RsmH [Candidatus Bipolaricaulota bacterium]
MPESPQRSQRPRAFHTPVLCREVVSAFADLGGGTLIDGTVGLGGHAEALLRADSRRRLVGIDRDATALALAAERLADFGDRATLFHGNFADAEDIVRRVGLREVEGLLLDLGASSLQFDDPERGFSFRTDGPLDMRMDRTHGPTAAEWLSHATETEISRALHEYGEERYARRIARALVRARNTAPIARTAELVRIVHRAVPAAAFAARIDPATRTFQALRIAVNGELDALARGLAAGFRILAPGGRMAVISFHSLEDRQVKTFFRERAARCLCPPDFPECRCGKQVEAEILTRKPIEPSPDEVSANARARSGKLRVCRKVA